MLADWREALAATGWTPSRQSGGEWCGPCPRCGGEDRFHIRAGRRVAVLAHCRKGCDLGEISRAVFGEARARPDPDPWRAGRYTPPPEWRETPGPARPSTPTRTPGEAREALAARLWARSVAVPTDPAHPARTWAARRDLWPASRPFPPAVRWLPPWRDRPGAVIAAFAPLRAWIARPEGPAPEGVQCVRTDGGKRSHGSMSGRVCVIGDPLPEAGRVHVAEGLADALAIGARCGGAVIAAGGTAGIPRMADALAALSLPVTAWPDGDAPGREAARSLADALRGRGLPVHVAPVPNGEDPASIGPQWRRTE